MESASEQPEPRSGTTTVASGERILAVSAMKTTPANTITRARDSRAFRAQVVGIPLEVADAVDHLGLDVGVGEDDRVLLLLQPVDLEREGGDLAAGFVVPGAPAGIAVDMHERLKEAFGLPRRWRGRS
jgi:hypothetical protein